MVPAALLSVALATVYSAVSVSAATTAVADVSRAASTTCTLLKGLLGSKIVLPTDTRYTGLSDENWSQTTWEHPSCIALPSCATDISVVIKAAVAAKVPFAIRSGGHSPNPFDANINTGVLIAMDSFSQTTYDRNTGLATIGMGARWDSVYTALDQHNLTVVGGRVMDVGVGGLTLGGGLSYLSDLYGLVCDNVVNYEVVLADGSIVEANSGSHSDLFWALKGSSNNFGVVTQITTKTYPIYQGWGGIMVFSSTQMPQLMQAFYEYQSTPNKDLYANMIINLAPTNGSLLLTLIYLKPVANPPAYAPFYSLTPLEAELGFMTLHQLMALFGNPSLPRWGWYSNVFEPNSNLYSDISNLLFTAPEVATISSLEAGTLVAAVQPISSNLVLAGRASNGGNALGLQAVNQTWFSFNVGWWNQADDAVALAALKSLHAKIDALAAARGVQLSYIFMNDANINQSVIAAYGATNVNKLRAVQKTYDPNHVFQNLVTGGQKIPAK